MKDIGSNNYVSTTTVARFMAKFDNEFNREDIEKRDFKLFAFHLNYFKDKVSDRMKTSINTCFYYIEYIKNSFIYDYSNGPIKGEGVNNFIKVLKRIAFGYRNFANFRTRIFTTRNLLAS